MVRESSSFVPNTTDSQVLSRIDSLSHARPLRNKSSTTMDGNVENKDPDTRNSVHDDIEDLDIGPGLIAIRTGSEPRPVSRGSTLSRQVTHTHSQNGYGVSDGAFGKGDLEGGRCR